MYFSLSHTRLYTLYILQQLRTLEKQIKFVKDAILKKYAVLHNYKKLAVLLN